VTTEGEANRWKILRRMTVEELNQRGTPEPLYPPHPQDGYFPTPRLQPPPDKRRY
jgi:hypothetical protein